MRDHGGHGGYAQDRARAAAQPVVERGGMVAVAPRCCGSVAGAGARRHPLSGLRTCAPVRACALAVGMRWRRGHAMAPWPCL